jgi:hypothetical protein
MTDQPFVVVMHFCARDAHLAKKNLQWVQLMGDATPLPFACVAAWDTETDKTIAAEIVSMAGQCFQEVMTHEYPAPARTSWPHAPNWAFRMCASHVRDTHNKPFLWWEADAVPISKGWLDRLAREYRVALASQKVFMGHIVGDVIKGGHMNGVGVYPADVGRWAKDAILANNAPWDVAMARQALPVTHDARRLIQHVWLLDKDGNPTNGAGAAPRFASWKDAASSPWRVNFTASLYHRCKDGSLQDILMANFAPARFSEPSEAQITEISGDGDDTKPPGQTSILIVTHARDFQWLEFALASIDKFATGFDTVYLCIPSMDADAAGQAVKHFKHQMRIKLFDEAPGKGMLHHMERIGNADKICFRSGKGCRDEFILHMDADCVFTRPTGAGHYFRGGKPIYVVRSYDSLIDAKTKAVSDCYQWKAVTERQLGEPVAMYTMCRHPTVFPAGFYALYRKHIESVHGKSFLDWHLEQRNEFPQTAAEFPSMGAFAWKYMHDSFHWIDAAKDPVPADRIKAYWSHGGLDQKVHGAITARQEIEAMLGSDNLQPAASRASVISPCRLRIWVYTHCRNERLMMPYFLRHYCSFADRVTVFDDKSSDGTRDIVAAEPRAILRDWPGALGLDDIEFCELFPQLYAEAAGNADWVMWVDADEFIYHPDIRAALGKVGGLYDIVRPSGWSMISEKPPGTQGQIYDELKMGINADGAYDKPCVFVPRCAPNWTVGRHSLSVPSQELSVPSIKLLHYRWLGVDYVRERNARNFARQSDRAKQHKLGWTCRPDWQGDHSHGWVERVLKHKLAKQVIS